ncbi:MAG: NACHT domain-containing protein [Rhodobacter sp.]|nr:NACHT domain-containing protein [Rhodobacter sp.]
MSSGRKDNAAPKWPHTVDLYLYINERRESLGLTWEELEAEIRGREDTRFGAVTARSMQTWAKGKTAPKYEKVMAALLALDLDEAGAFDEWTRICQAHGVTVKTVATRQGKTAGAAAFPADEIRQAVLNDPQINHLPAVFETGERLPLATTFVDLRVIERRPVYRADLLHPIETPGQQIWQREKRLRLPRRPARQVLDATHIRPGILIGGPGSGKSALMRRVALDVAEGNWRGAAVPLFVELRRYWARREAEPEAGLTLLGYALERHLPRLRRDRATRDRLERLLATGDVPGVLLLADGLDEIAPLPAAVEAIYGELDALAGTVPWLASARPTGLHGHIGGARRLELDPLSIDAVEHLVTAWSKASEAPDWFAGALYAEIAASPSLRQMAGNPFLLTALCYLRYAELDRELPDSRAALYQRLFEQIARQAQRRHVDTTILDAEAIRVLEAFCHALYAESDVPKQIFSDFDWQRHGSDAVDFHRRILPARLLTALNEIDDNYHFMHLSLQEHLVARALVTREMPDVLRLRFHPAWRSVFRAYGALLYETGQHGAFRDLVTRLFDENDLLGVSLFNLAEIFADAGIRNTSDWIGEDIRETLWSVRTDGWNEVPAQALEALRTLDADFLEAKALLAMEEMEEDLDYLEAEYPEDFETAAFPGETYQQYGFDENQAPRVLARAGTDSAHRRVREIFLNGPQRLALAAATAFADIARPSDRIELAEAAKTTAPDSDMGYRLFAFAIASPSAELVPFLCRVAEHNRTDRNDLWDRTLGILMSIGGEEVVAFLKELLARDIAAWNAHPKALREAHGPIPTKVSAENHNLVTLLARFHELETSEHSELLDLAEAQLDTRRYRAMLHGERLKLGHLNEERLLADLKDPETRDEAIVSLIRSPVKSGKPPPQAVRAYLLRLFDDANVDDKAVIAEVEAAAIRAGGPPMAVQLCLAEARRLWTSFYADPDPNELSMLLTRLDSLLSPAQDARFQDALDLIYDILSKHAHLAEMPGDVAEDLLSMLMDAVRDILGGDCVPREDRNTARFSALFRALIFLDTVDVTQNAAAALGYLNLPMLLGLRGASTVDNVLEEISAEQDVMIFEAFWAGSDGRIHAYVDQRPAIVTLTQDDRGDEVSASLGHYLVDQGFARGNIENLTRRTIPAVVFLSQDPDEPDAERAEAQQGVLTMLRDEWQVPVLEWDLVEVENDPKRVAGAIADQIRGLVMAATE